MNATNPWYVAVEDTTVGPAATELVIRGIEHRKIPPEALVCPVGTGTWRPLAAVAEFHAAVVRSYPPPPPDSEEARGWLAQGFHFPSLGALPQFSWLNGDSGDEEWDSDTTPTPAPRQASAVDLADEELHLDSAPCLDSAPGAPDLEMARASVPEVEADLESEVEPEPALPPDLALASEPDVDVDVDVEPGLELAASDGPAVDWSERFQSYFLVGEEVELPDQQALLDSLSLASPETFRHDEALWNLALCLAFGSDVVGEAAARTFFSAVADEDSAERLQWMIRTLLGQGFVPSGIPREAGQRACRRLRSTCPPALAPSLPRELLQ